MCAARSSRFSSIERFAEIDSTNLYLLGRAAEGAPEGLVAVADTQTAGRGRLGRSWEAPPASALLVSVLLRPQLPVERMHLVTLASAIAAVDAVRALTGVEARVKWPNDVVVIDRKLAGILAEADGRGAVVVGMGLNLRDDWFPDELRDTATAVQVDRDVLLADWLDRFDRLLDTPDVVVEAARERSATLGREVRVELADGAFTGVARDLTEAGFLVVDDRIVTAGDVVHLRNT